MSAPDLSVDAERLREVCMRYGVSRLEVFGSVGRGDESPDSDIDVLYELGPGARLGWDIETLSEEPVGAARPKGRPCVPQRSPRAAAPRGALRGSPALCGVSCC